MSRNVSSKFWVSLAFVGSIGGIYGAGTIFSHDFRLFQGVTKLTYIALVVHMGPITIIWPFRLGIVDKSPRLTSSRNKDAF